MDELKIEFLPLEEKDHYHISINDENLCKYSYCYKKKWLWVHDEALFLYISNMPVGSLLTKIEKFEVNVHHLKNIGILFSVNPTILNQSNTHKFKMVSCALRHQWDDWSKPWSINDYFELFHYKVKQIEGAEISCDINEIDKNTGEFEYDLMNGIGVAFPILDETEELGLLYKKLEKLLLSIHDEVEDELSLGNTPIIKGLHKQNCCC